MQRIAIIGNAGGGNSVLARELGHVFGLPVLSVNDVEGRLGWTRADATMLTRALDTWHAEARWVIDGWGPWDSVERRFEVADTIIFVDLPLARLLAVLRRAHRDARRKVLAAIGTTRITPRVVHIRSAAELGEFRRTIALCGKPPYEVPK